MKTPRKAFINGNHAPIKATSAAKPAYELYVPDDQTPVRRGAADAFKLPRVHMGIRKWPDGRTEVAA